MATRHSDRSRLDLSRPEFRQGSGRILLLVILLGRCAYGGEQYSGDLGMLERLRRDSVVTALSNRTEVLPRERLEYKLAIEKFLEAAQSARGIRSRLAAFQLALFDVRLVRFVSDPFLRPHCLYTMFAITDGSARSVVNQIRKTEVGDKEIPTNAAARAWKLVTHAPMLVPESKLRSSVFHHLWWLLTFARLDSVACVGRTQLTSAFGTTMVANWRPILRVLLHFRVVVCLRQRRDARTCRSTEYEWTP
jgi:hypothetical protein